MQRMHILDIRDFMAGLLQKDLFDAWLLSEANITTYVSWHVDGNYHLDYFEKDESDPDETGASESLVQWKHVRPSVFYLIKGQRTPLKMQIVLRSSAKQADDFLQKSGLQQQADLLSGLFINIRFENKTLSLTTGCSLKSFTLDKTLEQAWDREMQQFLHDHGLAIEV